MHTKKIFALLLTLLLALTILLPGCTVKQPVTEPPTAGNGHIDANGDEICDDCGIHLVVVLDFYALNDLHGVFNDTASNPGVDELTTYLKNAYADDGAYEIVLSSGDMWQGSVESSSNRGALMTQWMNELNFVSMTLGNHEYDWGSEGIADNAQLAEFPFLGINVTDGNVDAAYCQPSVVVERGGVKIGIIGAIGDCKSSISGEFTDGVEFATGDALTQLVMAEATRLRQEEGCNFIVYSLHEGSENSTSGVQNAAKLDYYDIALSDGYVDLVFEAHTHQDYILKDANGVYHLQAGGYNSAMSYASVSYNLLTDTYEVKTVSTLDTSVYADDSLEGDGVIKELFTQYFPQDDPYTTVLGHNSMERSSATISQTVAQLYLEKGKELWGAEYEIVLAGGFIKCRTPYKLSPGNVTYSQLYSLLPFDNDLVLCQVTGKQLNDTFIHSKNKNYYCAYDADLMVDENKTYYIVTDTYTSFYQYNMFPEVARLEQYYARDLLKDYIAAGNWEVKTEKISIAQANAIGSALGDNETTREFYELTGTVTSVTSTLYGNLYIQDEDGNSLYLYGLYDASGTRYDKMTQPPKEGDTITVTGAITKYIDFQGNAVVEIKSASLKENG